MKHKKAAVLLLLFVCVLIAVRVADTPEKRTIRYFHNHRAALEDDISNTIETGRATSKLNTTFNYWDGEHPIVEYIVVSRGIVSASRYYGFFYSFDNEPVSFQNSEEPLTPISERVTITALSADWTRTGFTLRRRYKRRFTGNTRGKKEVRIGRD